MELWYRSGILFLSSIFLFANVAFAQTASFRVGLATPGALISPGERVSPLSLALSDGLLGFNPTTGLVKPGLAESWVADASGVEWTFTLRSARWSDGSPLTAADFVDSWKRAGVAATKLEAIDPRHLRVVFPQPLVDVSVLTSPQFLLFPDPAQPKKGCGPFVVESELPGKSLRLVKNIKFREASTIAFGRLDFLFALSQEEADALFRDGLVDWVPVGSGPAISQELDGKNAVVSPGWGSLFLRINTKVPRLADLAFRKTLHSSLDRVPLTQGGRGTLFLPTATLIPPATYRAPLPPIVPEVKAGPRLEAPLTILYPQGETYRFIAEGIADQWKRRLKISVETKAAPFAQVRQDRSSGAYEMVLSGWLGDFPDPATFLGVFRSDAGGNDMGWASAAFDQLLVRLSTETKEKERTALLAKAVAQLTEEVPAIPLFSYVSVNRINLKKWSGWAPNPTDIHPWQGIAPKK